MRRSDAVLAGFSDAVIRRAIRAGVFSPVCILATRFHRETWAELPAIRSNETEHWLFPTPPRYAHLKHVDSHPAEPKKLYASIEQGALLRSTDGGESWAEVESFLNQVAA